MAGGERSRPVAVRVAPSLALTATRRGARIDVAVVASPAQAGASVLLGAYVRERFDFLPVRRLRLDARSRATATLRAPGAVRLRATLTRPLPGSAAARSRAVTVHRAGR